MLLVPNISSATVKVQDPVSSLVLLSQISNANHEHVGTPVQVILVSIVAQVDEVRSHENAEILKRLKVMTHADSRLRINSVVESSTILRRFQWDLRTAQ